MIAAALIGVLGPVLTGCAGSAPSPAAAGPTPPAAAGSASVTAPPAAGSAPGSTPAVPPVGTGAAPSPSFGSPLAMTLSGVVVEGAEPSCRILAVDGADGAGGGRWALTGAAAATLGFGAQVTVTGTARPDLRSPCGRVLVIAAGG